jgi:hypothetical protein
VTHWFRVHGHEQGVSTLVPDFVVDNGQVSPTAGTLPIGAPVHAAPWFEVVGGRVFPTLDHPAGQSGQPWFEVVGSFVYPVEGHPDGPGAAPWYQVRRPSP